MLERLLGLDARRQRLLRHTHAGPLQEFLTTPFPLAREPLLQVPLVAVDLETTGLDPEQDEIVSVGLVELQGLRVKLATAWHVLVTPSGEIPEQSAVVHHITDDRAAAGEALEHVLPQLLRRLAGKVMICHFARIERQFIDAACRRLYGGRFLTPVIDTFDLARRALEQRHLPYSARELRLWALRERYNLPRYRAHNALNDAIATAELFTAQVQERENGPGMLPLRRYLLRQ